MASKAGFPPVRHRRITLNVMKYGNDILLYLVGGVIKHLNVDIILIIGYIYYTFGAG